MTAAELARYNLTRLVRESGCSQRDIAVRAWPLPAMALAPFQRWSDFVDVRAKKLRRYMGIDGRGGSEDVVPITIPLNELDNLARALGVPRAEFLREVDE